MSKLDNHTTQIRATARSTRWLTPEVKGKLKEYRRKRRLHQQGRVNVFTLRAERNSCYYSIRLVNRICWATFLQRSDKILEDSEQCRTALRYTRLWVSSTTPPLRDPEDTIATSLEDKTEMVGRTAFPAPLADLIGTLPHREGTTDQRVDAERVRRTLFDQLQKKEP